MRTFNYLKDYNLLTSSVQGYLTQLSLELNYLIKTSNNKEIYYPLYKKLQEFQTKYPNLRNISYDEIAQATTVNVKKVFGI